MKVFCVGFNKTGTTGLHEWFVAAGLDSAHDGTYQKRTRTMEREALRAYLDAHEAFSDGERADVTLLQELYPEARFVLNTRPLLPWLQSRVQHVFRGGGVGVALAEPTPGDRRLRPGPWAGPMAREYLRDPAQAISDWVDRRETYHRAVLAHFAGVAGRLLVLDVTTDPAWSTELGEFLGLRGVVSRAQVIHANEASADPDRFDMPSRLAQVEVVLAQKAIPRSEWTSSMHVGFCGDA